MYPPFAPPNFRIFSSHCVIKIAQIPVISLQAFLQMLLDDASPQCTFPS